MKITKFQVLNFKSFRDSNEIEFKSGFNIITGQNSAGKTTLLQTLALRFVSNPHRSLRTMPFPGNVPTQESAVRATLSVTRSELFNALGSAAHSVPQPQTDFPIPGAGPYKAEPGRGTQFVNWLSEQPEFLIKVRLGHVNNNETWIAEEGSALCEYPVAPLGQNSSRPSINVMARDNKLSFAGFQPGIPSANIMTDVAPILRNKIYRFSAERFNVGQSTFGYSAVLLPNASNLPEVINTLNANPERLRQLNSLICKVLPQVRQVSTQPLIQNQVQIIVWPHDPNTQRVDVAIPLNDCGTGVGQVIAILYVVLTSDDPQVILVDEPQSFLHPGAVRKLIDVLKQFPQHQYILSTHSPAVITAAEPATITIARLAESETTLEAIDPTSTDDMRTYLLEIGARLSDVFGADNILWVEGQTEEICFPRILQVVTKRRLMGTAIVGIRQTGNLQRRDKAKIFGMYQRLSHSSSLMPPALAFVLDCECLTSEAKRNIERDSQSLAHFLPRRMYENYLLSARAIAAIVNTIDGFRPQAVGEDEVQELLDKKGSNLSYFCPGTAAVPADWVNHVDAARALAEIFSELSETRVAYDKTKHSVAISDWILHCDPEHFRELADWLTSLLGREQ